MTLLTSALKIRPWTHLRNSVRLRDVFIFIALPVLVGFYLIAASISDYSKIHQFDDPWSIPAKLNTFFVGRISAALDLPKMLALQRRLDPEKNDTGIVRLSFPPGLWNSWQSDPLALIDQWNDATLVRGNSWSPVKLRKRGDNSVHWTSEKKSFTLRTPSSSLFKGYRRLVFSAKSVLDQYIVNRLTGEFDLLTPFTTVAPVFVNEKFYGIFRVSELIDESFLRRQSRMPGNIFRGDTAERGEYFKGLPRGLAVNPYIWDRVAKDHRPDAYAESILQAFLRDVNASTFDDHLRLMSWVDVDEVARMVALMLIVGDPFHLSNVHNNFWYEDPSSGLLHPIPWDLRLVGLEKLQVSQNRLSRILAELLRNPFVLDRALHVAQEKVANDRLIKTAEQIVRSVYERYKEHFEYDRLREPFTPVVGDPDQALSELSSNIRLLKAWFQDSLVAFHAKDQGANGIILDFEARGYAGSDLHAIVVEGDVKTAQTVQLMADRNRNGILDPSDPEVAAKWTVSQSGGRLVLAKPPALLPGVETDKQGFKSGPIHYRFFLHMPGSIGKSPHVARISAELRNRLTGEPSKTMEWRAGDSISAPAAWHPWQYPSSSPVVRRLSGNVRLRETLVIQKGDTLIIDAGTTVQMDPDVSILSYGRVVARGTSDRPITFRPSLDKKPWGTFALQGEGASGSEFEHVRFGDGGGAFLGQVEYKGMVTVHWAKQVSFRNCEFSDNVRSDDALNAVHSYLTIEHCTFRRANSDAVDFDYSSGKIANNRFEASGNDAIDLMGSAPQIINNHINGSGDKGISIGEGSHPFVFNNFIARSNRGIEVKDGSEPFLVHNTITQNTIGLLQSAKNWRYGTGGWAKLVNSVIVGNGIDIKSDKDSRLSAVASGAHAGTGLQTLVRSGAGPSGSADVAWVFAHYGILPRSNSAGQISDWTALEPVAPKVMANFKDDLEGIADGWVAAGGVSRLEKRDQDLQVTFSKIRGHIIRKVDWNLTDPNYAYLAVFELAGRDIRSAGISVISADGEVARPFEVNGALASYAFISLQLKPARYKTIKIAADPGPSNGRVHLHTYHLYAIPRGDALG
jgi:hypothetical protein